MTVGFARWTGIVLLLIAVALSFVGSRALPYFSVLTILGVIASVYAIYSEPASEGEQPSSVPRRLLEAGGMALVMAGMLLMAVGPRIVSTDPRFGFLADQWRSVAVFSYLAGFGLTLLGIWRELWSDLREKWTIARDFLREVLNEMRRVTWPSRKEVSATTVVVIVTSAFFGLYLWGFDLAINAGVNWIFRRFGVA